MPKPPPFGLRTPPSVNTSAAFSRQPLHKDPTPSISRLKGGGGMLEWEREGGKRLSDLKEHWAPSTDPMPASLPANKPVPTYRKSWTPAPKPEPVEDENGWDAPKVLVAPPLERRRLSFDAFGSLPVLEEVRTPAATLVRKGGSPLPVLQDEDVLAPAVPEKKVEERDMVTIEHNDRPIPTLDIAALVNAHNANTKNVFDPKSILTISVEVLLITGTTATALPTPSSATFHDTEALAIVHRYKSKLSGNRLVNTKVWAWYGKKSTPGKLEHAKLSGLVRRYGVALEEVTQSAEGEDGGELACRQGSRTHWSCENTTMHVVRSLPSSSTSTSTSSAELLLAIIDELDLSIANLCSGFSYILTLLASSYIWHGRGSLAHERVVARIYIKGLFEGREEEDGGESAELFWMMLGERETRPMWGS
ncbi:unnamed protein product [Peniophora sp. CBMAI 1063]|nr:unnamed protein product [Peniophora sp. CBMAI 1063]